MQQNGYFRLNIKEDGTYLEVFAPTENGQKVTYDDLSMYLGMKGIIDYDKKQVGNALFSNDKVTEVRFYEISILPIDEYLVINISDDRRCVTGRFYPPTTGGQKLTKKDIINFMVQKGVKYGVNESTIDHFISNPVYCTDLILAEALLPVQGKDASIEYRFNTDLTLKPKRNEDGSVDFHQLNTISHCAKGDILAVLTPVDPGKPGIDVCGNVIRQNSPKNRVLKHGKNIHLSDDGLIMYSDVNGHVNLTDDRVFVSDNYEVTGDVGPQTGDINYDGNVTIKGSILTGFSVRTRGDVIVEGVVEGAYVDAGGQIILKRGMQGMNRGILRAGGNIISKFFESADISSGGYISTEAILHSTVSAKGDVIVGGKRGFVTGGQIRSGSMIQVKTAGSTMGTATVLEVGIDPAIIEEFHATEKKLKELSQEKSKCNQIIDLVRKRLSLGEVISPERKASIKAATQKNIMLEVEIKKNKDLYEELRNQIDNSIGGVIKVEDTIYPGCKLIISNVINFVRAEEKYCRFVKEGADIKRLPFS